MWHAGVQVDDDTETMEQVVAFAREGLSWAVGFGGLQGPVAGTQPHSSGLWLHHA